MTKIEEILFCFIVQVNFNFSSMFLQLKLLLFLKFHLMNLLQLLRHSHFQTILITKMSRYLLQSLYFCWLLFMCFLLILLLAHCSLKLQELNCSEYFYFIAYGIQKIYLNLIRKSKADHFQLLFSCFISTFSIINEILVCLLFNP